MKVLIIFVVIAIASLDANPAKPISKLEAGTEFEPEKMSNPESDLIKHRGVRSHHRKSEHGQSHQQYYAPAEPQQYYAPGKPQQYYGPMALAQQQYYASAAPAAAAPAASAESSSTEAPKAASPKKSTLASKFLHFLTTFIAAMIH